MGVSLTKGGNVSLTKQMKSHLAGFGPVVQDTADGADFIVQGNVRVVPIGGGGLISGIAVAVTITSVAVAASGAKAGRAPSCSATLSA